MQTKLTAVAVMAGLSTLAFVGWASGDVLYLNDGSTLVGDIKFVNEGERRGYRVTDADGAERFVPQEDVQRIVMGRNEPAATRPGTFREQGRLDSLRRSVQNLTDLPAIIGKYENFLQQVEDGPVADEAKKELAIWSDRLDRGLVKLGGEWVTTEERDRRLAASLGTVNEVRLTLKSGDTKTAKTMAEALLDTPSTAPGGHYLLGVMALQEDDVQTARRHFEAVRNVQPDHAPTLANLAVVQTRINRADRAMWFLLQAMRGAPGNEIILNNTLEALQMLGGDSRDDRNAQQANTLFERQDEDLRARKAEEGLFRWGSTWVDQAELDRLKAIQAEIDEVVAVLKRRYDSVVVEVQRIEERISANQTYMQRLESSRHARDAEGNVITLPLPPEYYAAERENQQLWAERQRLVDEGARLEQQATAERQKMPRPPYSGELTPIDEDGVPVTLPPESEG